MFDFLPTVDDCCFCISLKIGSILIALCSLVAAGTLGTTFFYPICTDKGEGLLPDIIKYASYVSLGASALLMFCSFLFLIGACVENLSFTATLFLIAVSLFLLVHLVTIILTVIAIVAVESCRENLAFHVGSLMIPLWIYFMIVVKSFEPEMQ